MFFWEGVEINLENNKAILLELDVDEGKYIFPNTISDALIDANDERLNLEEQLNETLDTIKALKRDSRVLMVVDYSYVV